MNIDWSKAPTWATAVGKCYGSLAWISNTGYCFQGINNPPCHPYKAGEYTQDKFIVVARRPVAWTGEGLPPVTTQCEALHKCGQWVSVKIIDSMVGSPSRACRDENNRLWWATEFRPARTAEQIAEDKRTHEIRNALTSIKAGQQHFPNDFVRGNIVAATVEAMIDAGYRKP